jgi:hypothetical protein
LRNFEPLFEDFLPVPRYSPTRRHQAEIRPREDRIARAPREQHVCRHTLTSSPGCILNQTKERKESEMEDQVKDIAELEIEEMEEVIAPGMTLAE